jgi:hypothetical protein
MHGCSYEYAWRGNIANKTFSSFGTKSEKSINHRATIWRRHAAAHGSRAIGWKIGGMAASSSGVRPASGQDAGACPAIYRPCVQNTAISWGIDVPTVDEMLARIEGLRATHECLVLARDDRIIGPIR